MPVVNPFFVNSDPAGPCEWPLNTTCVPGWDDLPAEQRDRATVLATFILDALTGHQFAQCPIVVRPCGPGCGRAAGYTTFPASAPAANVPGVWMAPYVLNGVWRNCGCAGGCTCAPACRVDLGRPVATIDEVKVNGLVLDPSAYSMIGKFLARTDGGECWPACQDVATPDTEDGTFSVTFRPGRILPAAGEIAAGMLAGEFAKACAGGSCALPPQIASLTRQGVDVEFVDPTEVLTEGRTGIREVDLFIAAVNPAGKRQRSRVFSPDIEHAPVVY